MTEFRQKCNIIFCHVTLKCYICGRIKKTILNLMQKNGLKIKEIMQEKGISVTQMSEKLGVTRQSLYRCLNRNPTMNRLKEIADILDVSPKDLFGDEKKD